jgi:hypothetical protein
MFRQKQTNPIELNASISREISAAVEKAPTVTMEREAQFSRIVMDGIGPYKMVGGHHPLQQAAFKDHPKYNAGEALAVSEERLAKYGDRVHSKISSAQHALQKELKLSGRPNTMQEQVRISWQAMEKAGVPQTEARNITAQAFWDLRAQGVKQPTALPWGGAKK